MSQFPANPIPYPIPVVRAIISDAQGRVLLLRRANTNFGQDAWCLPGGKIDCGQNAEAALTAELAEELAVQIEQAVYLFSQDSPPGQPSEPHFLNLYFYCRVAGEIQLNKESSAYAWIGPDDLADYVVAFGNAKAIRRFFAGQTHTHSVNSLNLA